MTEDDCVLPVVVPRPEETQFQIDEAQLLEQGFAVFTGHYRGGWVALERETAALGIALVHSRPYDPTTCGKVERVHQTVKKWLARVEGRQAPAAPGYGRLEHEFDSSHLVGRDCWQVS